MSGEPGGPLSDVEVAALWRLLARYAWHDLDQWENWSIDQGKHVPVYVRLSRGPFPGEHEEGSYAPVWPLPPHLSDEQPPESTGG